MEYGYYPGCSLLGTAQEYDESIRQVFRDLGLKLVELPDWNCCGASSGHVTDNELAIGLAARNLAIADESGRPLVVPCAACFNRLKFAEKALLEAPHPIIGRPYSGKVRILHVNDVLADPPVLAAIRAKRKRALSDLAVVPYYGCLTVRPPKVTGVPEHEDPKGMDKVLEALGADLKPWSYKTDCCGGSLAITRPDVVRRLSGRLFDAAIEAGAEAVVTDCPLCQSNLDTRQDEIARETGKALGLPVFYITELISLALQAEGVRGYWRRHFVDPQPLLARIGW